MTQGTSSFHSRTLLFLYITGLTFVFGVHPIVDPDLWWHIASGQWIVDHLQIPRADPFSYTAMGKPWVHHEWGAGVLFWFIFTHFQTLGLNLLAALLFFGVLFFYAKTVQVLVEDNRIPYASLFFIAWLSENRIMVRPHLFSYFFFSVLFFVLYAAFYKKPQKKILYLIPPLFLVWANLHGEVMLALGLLVLFWCGLLAKNAKVSRKFQWNGLLLKIIILSSICVLINPYFYKIYTFPFEHWGMEQILKHTAEWMPSYVHPWNTQIQTQGYFFIVGITMITVMLRWPFFRLELLFMGIALLYFSLNANRYIPLFILWAMPLITERWKRSPFLQNTFPPFFKKAFSLSLVIFSIVLLAYFAKPGTHPSRFGIFPLATPTHAVHFIEQHDVLKNQKIFHNMEIGGYLILMGIPVFIDGRTPLYGEKFFSNYLAAASTKPDKFKELEHHWNFTIAFLLRSKEGENFILHQYLFLNPNWALVYVDNEATLYVKKIPENLDLIASYQYFDSPVIAYIRNRKEQKEREGQSTP